ncbi:MAG TPA: xanthine dehydrogenase family protein subunit M [Acidimicrobiia bacterium]|jgi:carbon-monoxide dehydrogenase medium subunit|nr:xanthine dehydrogenase family protein subunit M [Acidimicrobiia bacterium]
MYPRSFEYVAPATIDEALTVLADNEGAKVLAGGMSLLPLMKLRLLSPELVVDIGRIPGLDQIEDKGDHISIGALVRHNQVASSELIQQHATALAQAASWTGDVQVRNRGTLCGSMAHADVAADQPAAVIALGATMVVKSSGGSREIAAGDFVVDVMTSALEPDEILVEIKLPKRGGGSAYDKLGRRGGHSDYAVAGASAWVRRENGRIADASVALTGVGTKPMLAHGVIEAIQGADATDDAIAAAADRAAEGVTVLEDLYGSVEYKTHLAKVFARRALSQALAAAS